MLGMKKSKPFQKINVEISSICNLACSFCPEVIRDKKLMSPSLFRKIISQVAPLTEQVCLHLMGDPLVHPDLAQFADVCQEFEVPIFLVTNGVLLRQKHVEILLRPVFRQVNFSLHSFTDNFKDQDPTTYLERIFSFTERAFAERPELYINYRLWNLEDPRGTGAKNREMLKKIESRFGVSINEANDVRVRKNKRLLNRLYLHFDTEFVWPRADLPVLGVRGTCLGLSSHFGILVDGTVVPCCLDKEGDIALGNIESTPVAEILESARAKKMVKGFRDHELTEDLCTRCQYIERFQKATPMLTPGLTSTVRPIIKIPEILNTNPDSSRYS
jgi:radical SAM protein with 4Fe4S-binding SPASM domain